MTTLFMRGIPRDLASDLEIGKLAIESISLLNGAVVLMA
jgi:hypothetical protein